MIPVCPTPLPSGPGPGMLVHVGDAKKPDDLTPAWWRPADHEGPTWTELLTAYLGTYAPKATKARRTN